jgi:hypothetical protein
VRLRKNLEEVKAIAKDIEFNSEKINIMVKGLMQ